MTDPRYNARFAPSQWWRDARFGMFIHWGAYAVPARGEWVRSTERLSLEDYQVYIDAWDPHPDMDAWADLAARAGMKYAVLTAKHHDGYALFASAHSSYTTAAKLGRDFVAEFLAAFRKRGIRVGLYFSVIDWARPDFPHYADRHHPMRGDARFKHHIPNMDTYRAFMHAQVRELCTNYGRLDIMWFDFSYPGMRGAEWGADTLCAMVRGLQPGIITDNRLEGSGERHGSIVTPSPSGHCGDFVSPELLIPPAGPLCDDGSPVPWESCVTLNNHWGYVAGDEAWKSGKFVVRKLVEAAAKDGNLLLNVGPDAGGRIPPGGINTLTEVGRWMEKNGESVYACGKALAKPEWGWYTRKTDGGALFAHIFDQPLGPLPLFGVRGEDVRAARLLASGEPRAVTKEWVTEAYPDTTFLQVGEHPFFTLPLPDDIDTVMQIELRDGA
jgi:alpha-L-fucosidase